MRQGKSETKHLSQAFVTSIYAGLHWEPTNKGHPFAPTTIVTCARSRESAHTHVRTIQRSRDRSIDPGVDSHRGRGRHRGREEEREGGREGGSREILHRI